MAPTIVETVTADMQRWLADPTVGKPENMALVEAFIANSQSARCRTMLPILPLLHLNGKPYHLQDHFPMEPMFNLDVPRQLLWKCGRQVSKSTSLTAQGILQSGIMPYFSTLFVAPRYEQIRKFSANYVRPMLENSPIASLLTNSRCENSVLQKTLKNGSIMYFTFAFLDADRARGIPAKKLVIDEVQDIDWDHLPVLRACLAAAKNPPGLEQYSGTPKTHDNTIHVLWEDSSQAEWTIKCTHCNHYNIPAAAYDIMKMIGRTGLICCKCGGSINSRSGRWVHAFPEKRPLFSGYHVPQIILPMHNEPDESGSMDKWLDIVRAMDGYQTTQAMFMNEILGEACDVGVKLVTVTELKEASTLNWNNEYREALHKSSGYHLKALGVDWGGGGLDQISMTGIGIVGMTPAGKVETIYMERLHANMTHHEEVATILKYFKDFGCHFLAHDFGGSGDVREAMMIQAGLPLNQVVPFLYVRASSSKSMVSHTAPSSNRARHYWSLDKARSLTLLTGLIKTQGIAFPRYESCKDLLSDFLSLIEDKHEMPKGADLYLITRNPKMRDDVCHAINYACVAMWHHTQRFPDLAKAYKITLTKEQRNFVHPPKANFSGA